jgi:hypothetical protein
MFLMQRLSYPERQITYLAYHSGYVAISTCW